MKEPLFETGDRRRGGEKEGKKVEETREGEKKKMRDGGRRKW